MNKKYHQELLQVLREAARDPKMLDSFLVDLLTPKEYEEIATRWQIITRLAKGDTQRAIADELGVGIATVTRGAKSLEDKKGGFWKMLGAQK